MTPKIRCKVLCTESNKNTNTNGTSYSVRLSPVYGEDGENKEFWEATPAGSVEFQSLKECPWEVGKEYYVDFTEIAKD